MIKHMLNVFVFCSITMITFAQPNMVLFLADDCTYRDIGCYGSSDSKTPAIDQLAAEGMRFTSCYQSSAMCSPTRHNLFNGMYPVRTGAYPNHTFAKDSVKSLPHYLQAAGYRVGFIGKWHIGPKEVYPFEYLGDKAEGKDYLDLSAIEPFFKEVAEAEQPFCLVVCSHQPHGPYTVGDPSQFDQEKLALRKNMVDTPQTREVYSKYLAEINFMDDQVGTVLKYLDQYSFSDNSLVIFLGEQGSSFPLSKWTCYEDGVKSAFVARWPGVIKPSSVSKTLVEYNDIVPTFVAAAGGKIPAGLDGTSLIPVFKNPEHSGKKYAFSLHTTRGIIQGSDHYGIRSVTDGRYRYIYNLSPDNQFSNGFTSIKNKKHWWGSWREKAKTDEVAAKLVNQYLSRPKEELYDILNDKDNLKNLADSQEYETVKAALKKALLEWMDYCGDEGVKTELLAYQHMKALRSAVEPVFVEELMDSIESEPKMLPGQLDANSKFKGYIQIPRDGYYTFYKDKKNKKTTQLMIDGVIVIPEDKKAHYGMVGLKKGTHALTIIPDSKQGMGGIKWSGPDIRLRAIPDEVLFIAANTVDQKPNIVFILTDDQGYGDLGCYGSETIATPNIDTLCEQGMKFTSFYVHSTCSPTRLSFMTGSYAHRIGGQEVIYWWDRIGISEDEITIAELLQSAGYATAAVGKWHMGPWPCFNAVNHGFDTFYGFMTPGDGKGAIYRDTEIVEKRQSPITHGKYTEKILAAGVEFIRENKDKPFFLYYASPLPHDPWIPGKRFKGTSKHGKYGDVVQEIDYQVGVLMDTLDELGLTENTLVVFTSDNGPRVDMNGHGSAGPLRDGKWSTFEGGIRVPCIMRWPGEIPAGAVNDEIAAIFDMLPTFCELSGAEVPTDRVIDGKSILPYMLGEKVDAPIHGTFVLPGKAIRYKNWKLYVSNVSPGGAKKGWGNRKGTAKGTLFNLKDDSGETTDVSAQHPEVVAKLKKMMNGFMKELNANKREIGKTPDYTDEKRKAAWKAIRAGKRPESDI